MKSRVVLAVAENLRDKLTMLGTLSYSPSYEASSYTSECMLHMSYYMLNTQSSDRSFVGHPANKIGRPTTDALTRGIMIYSRKSSKFKEAHTSTVPVRSP